LLGDGESGTQKLKKYTVRKKIFCSVLSRADKAKNLLYWHDEPNEPTKEGPPSFVFRRPHAFAPVSTVSRGHPSLVSLIPIHNTVKK
jgi:hypothetical protein